VIRTFPLFGALLLGTGSIGAAREPPAASVVRETSPAVDGVRAVSVFKGHVSVTTLVGEDPRSLAFNATMLAWLDEQIAAYRDCAKGTPRGREVDFHRKREIALRAGSWVIVAESFDSFCGGPYPNSGTLHLTWNLDSGSPVEPWTWIRDSKSCSPASECRYSAPDALNGLLLAHAARNKAHDECADTLNANRSYAVWPSARGLVFGTAFAHALQACDETIELRYDALLPYLTEQGSTQLKTLTDAASHR
jgi:hypothetical protein